MSNCSFKLWIGFLLSLLIYKIAHDSLLLLLWLLLWLLSIYFLCMCLFIRLYTYSFIIIVMIIITTIIFFFFLCTLVECPPREAKDAELKFCMIWQSSWAHSILSIWQAKPCQTLYFNDLTNRTFSSPTICSFDKQSLVKH